jgi:hypothetical protein
MSRIVGNFFFRTKKEEMHLYCREKHLLDPLYVFVCPFVSVASILWIPMKAHVEDFRENVLEIPSFVKIGPKESRCLLEDLSVLQCIREIISP